MYVDFPAGFTNALNTLKVMPADLNHLKIVSGEYFLIEKIPFQRKNHQWPT